MRILLDEHLPLRLAGAITDHDVSTVRAQGWSGKTNGELLGLAVSAGFEIMITNDRSVEYQQNLSVPGIGILVLDAPTYKLEDLLKLAPLILEAIPMSETGRVRHLAG